MKKVIKRFIKTYLKKVNNFLIEDTIKEIRYREKKAALETFNSIKNRGSDSIFWGDKITVSAPNEVKLGVNVHIGNNAFIKSEGGLTIGSNTHISRNLVLYTVNHNYESDTLPYNNELIKKEVIIGKNVWIGMNVCITPGTTIGDGAIIGMGTVVSGVIPPLAIIGSEQWRILKYRSKEHYDGVERKGRYGKEDGLLYTENGKILQKVGDRIVKKRTILEMIQIPGALGVKKIFEKTDAGKNSMMNELKAYKCYKGFPWLPKILDKGEDFIIFEYFDNNYRLDKYITKIDKEEEKNLIFNRIILCILDIYSQGFAHCDVHAKNIFITNDGIKIIDFETSQKLNSSIDFFNSYDIVGSNLNSPHLTGNMCVFRDGEYTLKTLFNLKDKGDFMKQFDKFLKEILYDVSNTFFTRKDSFDQRHTLRNRFIYSTFDLKYLQVNDSIGQRRTKKRLAKFGVTKSVIKGKKVLDIGSNIGGTLLEIMKWEPAEALGFEYDVSKVLISNRISALHYLDKNLIFKHEDVESEQFLNEFNKSFDIVFCLAVIDHLKNKEVFFKKLGDLCNGILYFEGNGKTDKEYIVSQLQNNGFNDVKYLGLSNDEQNESNNIRPLFCAKK